MNNYLDSRISSERGSEAFRDSFEVLMAVIVQTDS